MAGGEATVKVNSRQSECVKIGNPHTLAHINTKSPEGFDDEFTSQGACGGGESLGSSSGDDFSLSLSSGSSSLSLSLSFSSSGDGDGLSLSSGGGSLSLGFGIFTLSGGSSSLCGWWSSSEQVGGRGYSLPSNILWWGERTLTPRTASMSISSSRSVVWRVVVLGDWGAIVDKWDGR